jgi:hypothetical protein
MLASVQTHKAGARMWTRRVEVLCCEKASQTTKVAAASCEYDHRMAQTLHRYWSRRQSIEAASKHLLVMTSEQAFQREADTERSSVGADGWARTWISRRRG